MGGISSGVGLISGINSASIIDQLLSIDARPKTLIQRRVVELQKQQAAFLDLNGRLSTLKAAAAKFATSKTFNSATAVSSAPDTLGATASIGAAPGTYSFLVDRGVTTQQVLTRAYADRNSSSLGATSVSFEPPQARLDSDTALANLNEGQGLSRGKIVVTDRAGGTATIDLSRVETVSEVLKAINENGTARVSARVSGGKFILTDTSSGTGALTVRSVAGYSTAESLKLTGPATGNTLTSSDNVYKIGDGTTLATLRDGTGIRINTAGGSGSFDFTIKTRDGGTYTVDIGDLYNSTGTKTAGAVATVQQLKERIASQTSNKVALSVRADGRGFELTDSTTGGSTFEVTDSASSGAATDLGLIGGLSTGATISGQAVLAGLNSTLASTLNAGQAPRGTDLSLTSRDGTVFNLDLDVSLSTSDLLDAISTGTSGKITATLGPNGNTVVLTDTTAGTGNLIASGTIATTLGVATAPAGVTTSTVTGSRINRQYVTLSSQLSQLNFGTGVGTGTFDIIGGNGQRASVSISSTDKTVGDVIARINATAGTTGVRARINDSGSGIVVEENSSLGTGGSKVTITDTSGIVAKSLNLAGTASGTGLSNFIDGSQRRTVALDSGDTLDTVITKINNGRAGVTASIITDGSTATPFRIRFASNTAGAAGALLVESTGTDLGLTRIAEGQNSRVFFGSSDPARAILVSRSTNTLDNLVDGVRLDIKGSSATPVTVTVSKDNAAIETAIQEFVDAYNGLANKLRDVATYNATTEVKGTLLGDSAATALRLELFNVISAPAQGTSGRYKYLSQAGVTVGTGGQLKLDSNKLRAALQEDPEGVANLFAAKVQTDNGTTRQVLDNVPGITTTDTGPATYTSLGVLEKLVRVADRYLDPINGLFTGRNNSLDLQIKSGNDRIADYDKKLAAKRTFLEAQYANLEAVLGKLQQQQGSISKIQSLTSS